MTERPLRYEAEGGSLVAHNGPHRFNRPLYCANTPVLVYAGDKPEFLLSLPGKGGTFWLGTIAPEGECWLSDLSHVESRYGGGAMSYALRDDLLRGGSITLEAVPLHDRGGFVLRVATTEGCPPLELVLVAGGASGFSGKQNLDLTGYNDPATALFRPEDCRENRFDTTPEGFTLRAPCHGTGHVAIALPPGARLRTADARSTGSPRSLLAAASRDLAVMTASFRLDPAEPAHVAVELFEGSAIRSAMAAPAELFRVARAERDAVAHHVRVDTPDPYVDALAPAVCVAADANWQHPAWLHGAVSWRWHYPGWRGAYAGTVLDWWDRQAVHFRAHARIQVRTETRLQPSPSEEFQLARQHHDSVLYSRGYIPSLHRMSEDKHDAWHGRDWYNMNEVLVDQLLQFWQWSGDLGHLRETWSLLADHLAWQKRCFDGDDDGLYESFADIHLSDGIQYSGAGCLIASAYTWRALDLAARYAPLAAADPAPYRREAEKTLEAINRLLWMPREGWYAECRDLLGERLLHPSLELPSVYHAIDSRVPDKFQAYQCLRYVDTALEHVNVRGSAQLIFTTNWVPVTNATRMLSAEEVAHAALAYWQAGRREKAFQLFAGTILDSLNCSRIPGNFIGYSEMDPRHPAGHITDHADTVGMCARALVEGLFGLEPDVLADTLVVSPGFPAAWQHARLETPHYSFSYQRDGEIERFTVASSLARPLQLRLRVYARGDRIASVTVDGRPAAWNPIESVREPRIEIAAEKAWVHDVEIRWAGIAPADLLRLGRVARSDALNASIPGASLEAIHDPQGALHVERKARDGFTATIEGLHGHRTAFARVAQGDLRWWLPIEFEACEPLDVIHPRVDAGDGIASLELRNNRSRPLRGCAVVACCGTKREHRLALAPGALSGPLRFPAPRLPGITPVRVTCGGIAAAGVIADWTPLAAEDAARVRWDTVPLEAHFNDRVTNIFRHEYRSPRSPHCSLQLPLHGVGEWCYYDEHQRTTIDDSTLRNAVDGQGRYLSPFGVPFATPGRDGGDNVAFVSQWDQFPARIAVPLGGRAARAYFLMAGSTNLMQSQLVNGEIVLRYRDGGDVVLPLRNPSTWWPIEREYDLRYDAFCVPGPHPPRIDLGPGTRGIVLDMTLDPARDLETLSLRAIANEVIIGLLAVTLVR